MWLDNGKLMERLREVRAPHWTGGRRWGGGREGGGVHMGGLAG